MQSKGITTNEIKINLRVPQEDPDTVRKEEKASLELSISKMKQFCWV